MGRCPHTYMRQHILTRPATLPFISRWNVDVTALSEKIRFSVGGQGNGRMQLLNGSNSGVKMKGHLRMKIGKFSVREHAIDL